MKILIYGAGVIGCTYGWQLAKTGCEISILVRKGKKQEIEEKGINIHCTDLRDGKKKVQNTIFQPKVIDTLSADNDFDYIIVTTNNLNLDDDDTNAQGKFPDIEPGFPQTIGGINATKSSGENSGTGTVYGTSFEGGNKGVVQAHENRPPYFVLAYIIKVK